MVVAPFRRDYLVGLHTDPSLAETVSGARSHGSTGGACDGIRLYGGVRA